MGGGDDFFLFMGSLSPVEDWFIKTHHTECTLMGGLLNWMES
jgi:hypothetical protein